MSTQLNAAIRLRAAARSAKQLKDDAALLKSLGLTKVKPDTSSGFAYILIEDEARDVVRGLKSKGWSGAPSSGTNAFYLTHKDHPGVKLEVTFGEDLEEDEIEHWGLLDEDSPVAMVSVEAA